MNLSLALGTSDLTLLELTVGLRARSPTGRLARHRSFDHAYVDGRAGQAGRGDLPEPASGVARDRLPDHPACCADVIERGTGRRPRRCGRPAAGQDRHDQRLLERVVHRLHAAPLTGRMGRLRQAASLGKDETGSRVAVPMWVELPGQGPRRQRPRTSPFPDRVVLVAVDLDAGGMCARSVAGWPWCPATEPAGDCGRHNHSVPGGEELAWTALTASLRTGLPSPRSAAVPPSGRGVAVVTTTGRLVPYTGIGRPRAFAPGHADPHARLSVRRSTPVPTATVDKGPQRFRGRSARGNARPRCPARPRRPSASQRRSRARRWAPAPAPSSPARGWSPRRPRLQRATSKSTVTQHGVPTSSCRRYRRRCSAASSYERRPVPGQPPTDLAAVARAPSFFTSGNTAALIGASRGCSFSTVRTSPPTSSSWYASHRNASVPRSAPADGSITCGK